MTETHIGEILVKLGVLFAQWRQHYNAVRPHSSLGYRPPAPEAIVPWPAALACGLQISSLRPYLRRRNEYGN